MLPIEELLHSAPDRIQEIRKGDVSIRLIDQEKKPIPRSSIEIKLIKHAFYFGSNAFRLYSISDPDLQQVYEERFASLMNFATLPFYWGYYEPHQGIIQAKLLEKMAAWCQARQIATKGHPLAWHEVFPSWALNLPDDEALRLLEKRVRNIPAQFRNSVGIWDVVNEATVSHRFDNAIGHWVAREGAVAAVEKAFQWARQSNPDAVLVYNDFNISQEFEQLVADLLTRGVSINAVGIQSHMHQVVWPLEKAWQVCEAYGRFGLPLHFTELTILSGRLKPLEETDWHFRHTDWKTTPQGEQFQAEYGEALYTLLFSHPAVQAITWWDFTDNYAWQGAPAGFLREDMSPKPLYDRLHRLVWGDWATHINGFSDENATIHCRCTFGKHSLTASLPSGESLKGSFDFNPDTAPQIDVIVS